MMAEITRRDIDRLSKIQRVLLSSSTGEQAAAASVFSAAVRVHGLHPADLAVVVTDGNSALADAAETTIREERDERRKLAAENAALRAANVAMRDHIRKENGPKVAAQLDRAATREQWPEFEELARVGLFAGKLPPEWRRRAANRLSITVATMQRWERGTAPIPAEVTRTLRDHLAASGTVASAAPLKAARVSDALVMEVAAALFSGESRDDILERHKVDPKIVEWRKPPVLRIEVKPSGSVTWHELWEMLSVLHGGRNWPAHLTKLGLPAVPAYAADLDQAIPQAVVQALRARYFAVNPWSAFERAALRIQASGRVGASWMEVLTQVRQEGVRISNQVSTMYSARFNELHGALFATKTKTAARYQGCLGSETVPRQVGMIAASTRPEPAARRSF